MKQKEWHSLDVDETLNILNSSVEGLSKAESSKLLEKFGPNVLQEEKRISPLKILLDQFKQFLIIILLLATMISLFLGEITDAIVIFAIVIASSILGFIQEYRANRAVEALKKLVTTSVRVIRDNREERVSSSEIVPGDIVLLSSGDKVTADGRIISSNTFKVNEASLTGEADPVTKKPSILPLETSIYNRQNMVFAGTVATYGRATVVVTSTGMATEFGKIAAMLQSVEDEETPLEKRMTQLGRTLGLMSIVVVALVFTLGIIRGNELLEMFLWAVSLAVAAVPEALPAVVTGSLAMGMQMMARRNAIVRRLPAVETLGSTSVICSDKTGTLTRGEMTVRKLFFDKRIVEVKGVGYSPEGEFVGTPPDKEGPLIQAALLCNDARLVESNDTWVIEGDPTEGALIVLAAKSGVAQEDSIRLYPRVGEIVFSSERKLMTTIHETPAGGLIAYMKGAPEVILERCSSLVVKGNVSKLTEIEKGEIIAENESMAKGALRVIGFAYKKIPSGIKEFNEDLEQDMIFSGLVGMIDPPRAEAKRAVSLCAEAGIKTVMITGDNKFTAMAVARELNILDREEVLTGEDLDKMSSEEFEGLVDNVSVYARVSPGDKMKIVQALKKKGHIVAATGDGVNDAPALKSSDIGVAMGITGTEATKESSDMILLDDNFATLVAAVEQGRVIYDNIKKFLAFLLSCNVGELLIMLSAGLMGLPLPLITVQILWVNLVTDGLPAIALGVDPPEPDIMKHSPRKPEETIFTSGIKTIILTISILMTVTLIPLFYSYGPAFEDVELIKARTIIFSSIVMFEIFNTFNCRSERNSIFQIGLFKNRYLLIALASSLILQLAVIYYPPLQLSFGTVPLDITEWLMILGISLTGLMGVETAKIILKLKKYNG